MMFTKKLSNQSPIVVFGTGGSGTRVVAEILRESGCYIGSNLNRALDNQDFGFFLGGRIHWMEQHFPFIDDGRLSNVCSYLDIFRNVYFKQPLSLKKKMKFIKVSFQYFIGKNRKMFRRRPLTERMKRGKDLLWSIIYPVKDDLTKYQRWGFKSPEAIYFIIPIMKFFPKVKLVHLIRDGRDMALSHQDNPLQYLRMFNLKLTDTTITAFNNWTTVNSWARKICRDQMPSSQYLTVKYEDLCRKPVETVDKILIFTGLNPDRRNILYNLPQMNPSIGRWKSHVDKFTTLDASFLTDMGYT